MSTFLRSQAIPVGKRALSTWSHLPMAPPDKILGMIEPYESLTLVEVCDGCQSVGILFIIIYYVKHNRFK